MELFFTDELRMVITQSILTQLYGRDGFHQVEDGAPKLCFLCIIPIKYKNTTTMWGPKNS